MKTFSIWAEQIVLIIIVSSTIEMILPENKNKKYIEIIIGIFILFTIISPFINGKELLNVDEFKLEKYLEKEEKIEVNQESMNIRLQKLYIEQLENKIKDKLEEEGFETSKCKIDAVLLGSENEKGIKSIEIKVKRISDEEKEKIIEIVSKYCEVESEIVKIR